MNKIDSVNINQYNDSSNLQCATARASCIQEQVQQQHLIHQLQAHNQMHMSQVQDSSHIQRLKVEDALTYLDQVKLSFGTQPHIYNEFLDVMKEFKTQSIDTSGVIHRVSNLFKDHPELIVGFNTFLPPGYKIELHPNDRVNVIFPNLSTSSFRLSSVIKPHSKAEGNHSSSITENKPEDTKTTPKTKEENKESVTVKTEEKKDKDVPVTVKVEEIEKSSNVPNATEEVTQENQKEEFNHAVNYVNKIKSRYHDQPEVYKSFLEILHLYQKGQKSLKDGVQTNVSVFTEAEVYAEVAKLFQNQQDLLEEFAQFLPESNSNTIMASVKSQNEKQVAGNGKQSSSGKQSSASGKQSPTTEKQSPNNRYEVKKSPSPSNSISKPVLPAKRANSMSSNIPNKKPRTRNPRFSSFSDAAKYGTLKEFSFFDKVRKALRSQEVYENFLRCIVLYNQQVVSRHELIFLVTPFLGKFPELIKWFKDLLGYKESGNNIEVIPSKVANQEYQRVNNDLAMEIDYSSCKKCGVSYRALPKNYVQPKCSGRTNLCKEVLNDTWVSFPSWSEDSTFVSSRKTQYEEYIYRCEDERFELDVVLETNLSAIRALEGVLKKIGRLPQEERSKFHLDDTLGGTSTVTHQRAIRRIYGDKSADIIEGLKKNPLVAVPLVLRRLKAKEEEWREAQKNFNKIWREQNEKYYLKSLDHQGITFKQNDIKFIRSKSLLNEIETLFEERHEQAEEGSEMPTGPNMVFEYKERSVLNDAANLIVHYVKRQSSIHKDDKQKIKVLIRKFIPEFFGLPPEDISDDEAEKVTEDDENSNTPTKNSDVKNSLNSPSSNNEESKYKRTNGKSNGTNTDKENNEEAKCNGAETESGTSSDKSMEAEAEPEKEPEAERSYSVKKKNPYNLIFANNNWYLFFRLHHILCERLTKLYRQSTIMNKEEDKEKKERKESVAIALHFKPKSEISLEEYYMTFIDMVKNLLDNNLESTQYEDVLREMFGIHAYVGFTLDKVVQNLVRQLQHIVSDEVCIKYMELYETLVKNGQAVGSYSTLACQIAAEIAYQKKAEQIQNDENCFKIILYTKDLRLTIELLDMEMDISEDPLEVNQWSGYVDDYVVGKVPELLSKENDALEKGENIFLNRNIHKWRHLAEIQSGSEERTESCMSAERSGRTAELTEGARSRSLSPMETVRQKAMEDMDILDNAECRFNVNSYKMLFVVRSESYLYKRRSLEKARQINKKFKERTSRKFNLWHKNWVNNNVSLEMNKSYFLRMYGSEVGTRTATQKEAQI
ncbi:paired amphipathic helix protein Sin3a-like [Centruroides sculpturatus]|uniref:paired amphipathic helix protein Sin3a-like n=1 Tax=Centruroides sculpturatus TaxID=218467 RepID=UPI000C6EEC7B|nr:paired amphipathic helix protein Sin3a-like [Centruroides sculpturatus]